MYAISVFYNQSAEASVIYFVPSNHFYYFRQEGFGIACVNDYVYVCMLAAGRIQDLILGA